MSKYREKRQEIVDYLLVALENDTAPWQRGWEANEMPHNAGSGYKYRGGNAVRLLVAQLKYPTFAADPRWCTFKQASDNGWKIKKGEKAVAHIEFWLFEEKQKIISKETGAIEEIKVPLSPPKVMVSPMFNAAQIEGIPPMEVKRYEWDPVQKAEELLQKSGAKILSSPIEDKACYNPSFDEIRMPSKERFTTPSAYYSTALHELAHWTGHKDRLDRKLDSNRTEKTYAREELVAEISSMFTQSEIGLTMSHEHQENHAAYVKHYVQILRKDPNDFFRAVSDAEKATDHVLQRERQHTQKQVTEAAAKIDMSATQDIDPQKIANIKAFLRGPKQQDINVYAVKTNGNYKGGIVHVNTTENIVVQQVGKISFVVHKLDSFDKQPIKGENLKIQYRNSNKPTIKEKTVIKTTKRRLTQSR